MRLDICSGGFEDMCLRHVFTHPSTHVCLQGAACKFSHDEDLREPSPWCT